MTENRTATQITIDSETAVRFEDNQPSSMGWNAYIGAVCRFDVNSNEELTVDNNMMSELACHTPLIGKLLVISETDPWYVTYHDVPKYLICDTADMDDEEFAERCPAYV